MKLLQQIRLVLDKLLESLVIVLVMALVAVVLWGIITRFLLDSPSRWTEEVAKFLLMWVALLGAPVAHGRREHLGFDYLVDKLDAEARRLLEVVAELVVVAFAAAVMIYGGFLLMSETLAVNQITPALGMKMGYVYAVVPISGFFIAFYSLHHLADLVTVNPSQNETGEIVSPE